MSALDTIGSTNPSEIANHLQVPTQRLWLSQEEADVEVLVGDESRVARSLGIRKKGE